MESKGLSNDTPINSRNNDLYSYSRLAERIADCICSANAEESSFAIGISGSWGSGKTSLINLIESELSDSKSHRLNVPEVLRFNPWRFNSQEQLLTEFFNALSSKLTGSSFNQGNGVRSTIGEALSAYSASIAYPSLASISTLLFCPAPSLGVALPLLAQAVIKLATFGLGKHLKNCAKTLDEQKSNIDDELKKLYPNLAIIIDDIDRLSDDEICLVFKLVALTASFPHVVYLLAYDRSVVERALNKIQKGDGAGYLEKIIQLPIEMPKLLEVDVAPQLDSIIQELQAKSRFTDSMDQEDRLHSHAVLSRVVLPLIRVPRDMCRLKNSAITSQMRTDDEICPADILGMSAIQCFAPDLSAWLWENSDYLFNTKSISLTNERRVQLNQEFENSVRTSCTSCPIEPQSISRHILGLDLMEKNGHRSEQTIETARIKGRVSSFDLFKLFYCSKIESSSSKTEFDLICNSSNSNALLNAFNNLDSNEGKVELAGRLIIGLEGITPERCLQLAEEVLILMSTEDDDLAPRLFFSPIESYTRLFEALGKRIGKKQFGDWLINRIICKGEDYFAGLIYFIRDERLYRERESLDRLTLTDDCHIKLCNYYSTWMNNNYLELLRRAAVFEFKIWQAIDTDFNYPNWNQFKHDLLENEEAAILFGTQQLSIGRSLNTGEVMFGAFHGGDESVTHEMVSSIWQKPWYASLQPLAKKFIAAHFIKTDPNQNDRDDVTDYRAASLVQEWDYFAAKVHTNNEE